MANRDFKKIERVIKDFSQNVGGTGIGSDIKGLVCGTLTTPPGLIGNVLVSSISFDEIYHIVAEEKQVVMLTYKTEDNYLYYATICNAQLRKDGSYFFDMGTTYLETVAPYMIICWNEDRQYFFKDDHEN